MEAFANLFTCQKSPHLKYALILCSFLDTDIRQCFDHCFLKDTPHPVWQQVELSMRYGVLGLKSLSHHTCAAFIASLCSSGFGSSKHGHLVQAITLFNNRVHVQMAFL